MFRLVRDRFRLYLQEGDFGFSVENRMLGVRWTTWRPERRQWSQPQVNCDEALRPGEGTQMENGDGYERQQVVCVGSEAPAGKRMTSTFRLQSHTDLGGEQEKTGMSFSSGISSREVGKQLDSSVHSSSKGTLSFVQKFAKILMSW